MPLRSAILRACARSASGRRIAICTLLFLFSVATRPDPKAFPLPGLASADFCFTKARPAGLAHQSASSFSLLNSGICRVLLFIGNSLSLRPSIEVVALLPGIEVVGRDHPDFVAVFRIVRGEQSTEVGLASHSNIASYDCFCVA